VNDGSAAESERRNRQMAIRAYARRLCEMLGRNIGVLSQANEPMPRAIYQSAGLQQYDPHQQRDWSALSPAGRSGQPIGVGGDRGPEITLPVTEETLFAEWRAEGYCKPLLIVAPAGAGKSCLLESLALQMAHDLTAYGDGPQCDPWPVGVPLLISLTKMSDRSLEAYVQMAERDLTRTQPTLSGSLLNDLRKRRRLILLIDGFDEVPTVHDDLVRVLKIWTGGFALTSRPGHGEWRVVGDSTRQRALQTLTLERARTFVREYFTERPCRRASTNRIVETFGIAWTSRIGRLLRRPLYVKAWCDYVKEEEGKRVPACLGDMAHLVFLRTLESRNCFEALRPAVRDAAITGFIAWFGRLGSHFAEKHFEPQRTHSLTQSDLLGSPADTFSDDGNAFAYESVAQRCGLLTYSKQTDKYDIPKVPLVEYVIGRYLADDAVRHPASPTLLLDTFRCWICRPAYHDILDYTLDSLWNAPRQEKPEWASALLQWCSDVAISAFHDEHSRDVYDDWAHPFAIAVLRWSSLQPKQKTPTSVGNVSPFPLALKRLITCGLWPRYLKRFTLNEVAVVPLLHDILGILHRGRGDAPVEWYEGWDEAIRVIVAQVAPEVARDLVGVFLEEHHRRAEDAVARSLWCQAVASVVRHVDEQSSAGITERLLSLHDQEAFEKTQQSWRFAIRIAATRVSEDIASDLVHEWLRRHDRLLDRASREALREAIAGAASRIRQDVAAECICRWIGESESSLDEEARHARCGAVRSAAIRLPEQDATRLVCRWVEEEAMAGRVDREGSAKWEALVDAVKRISNGTAMELLDRWIKQRRGSPTEENAQRLLQAAAVWSARRIDGEAVESVVTKLIERSICAVGDSSTRIACQWAIRGAAEQVSPENVRGLVNAWLEQYRKAAEDDETQRAWRAAIVSAAGCVRGELADEAVMKWMVIHDRLHNDPDAQHLLREAIGMAAQWVSEDVALDLANDVISRDEVGDGICDVQGDWNNVLRAAVQHIQHHASLRDRGATICSMCNVLLAKGYIELAFEIAAHNSTIAILPRENGAHSKELHSTSGRPMLRAVLREDQRLDQEMVVAPPLVRAAFIEKRLCALEGSFVDSGADSHVSEASGEAAGDIDSIRNNINVLKQFAECAAQCGAFEGRLVDIAARVEGRPATGGIVRDELENVNLSASAVPTGSSLTLPKEEREREKFIKHLRIFYEIGKLQRAPVRPSYEQIEEAFRDRRAKDKDFPREYPYTSSSVQRWCTKTLPAFFRDVFGLKTDLELFEKFGANNSNSGLSATGQHIWKLTRDCLRSEGLPPFNN
jgi:hypothetical protein